MTRIAVSYGDQHNVSFINTNDDDFLALIDDDLQIPAFAANQVLVTDSAGAANWQDYGSAGSRTRAEVTNNEIKILEIDATATSPSGDDENLMLIVEIASSGRTAPSRRGQYFKALIRVMWDLGTTSWNIGWGYQRMLLHSEVNSSLQLWDDGAGTFTLTLLGAVNADYMYTISIFNSEIVPSFLIDESVYGDDASAMGGSSLTPDFTSTLNDTDISVTATADKIVQRDGSGDIFGVRLHAAGDIEAAGDINVAAAKVINANAIHAVSDLGDGIESVLTGHVEGGSGGARVIANADYWVLRSGVTNFGDIVTATFVYLRDDATLTIQGWFDSEGNEEMYKYITSRLGFGQNVYDDGGVEKYIQTAEAYKVTFASGKWTLYKAASGTADTTITWTEVVAFSVDGSDELLIEAPGSFGDAEGDEQALGRLCQNPQKIVWFSDQFLGNTLDASWSVVTSGSGSGFSMNNQATGAITLKSGTSVLASTLVSRGTTTFKYYRHTSRSVLRSRVFTTVTGGDNISVTIGFADSAIMGLGNHVTLTFNPSIHANWRFDTYDGTTANTTTSSIAGATARNIEILWEAGNVQAWINGTLIATYTTNVPTSQMYAGAQAVQGAAATSRLFYLYYFNTIMDGL